MKLPDMLKILRNAKSLTQQDAAKALKIRQYNLSDYETGRATPSIELLIKMADLYEVTLDDMLGREFKNTPYLSSTSSSNLIIDNIADLHTLKIVRRVQNLSDKEKEQVYQTIDAMIKAMFQK